MKIIKYIFGTLLWTVVLLYTVLVVSFHIPAIQRQIGTWTAEALGDVLGTKVEVGRVDLGFINRLIIDDVLIYDQQGKEMLRVARLSAKADPFEMATGRIAISSAQLFGPQLTLYKASEKAQPNFQFVIDSLSSNDTTSNSTIDLRINSFIMRHGSVAYDRLDIAPEQGRFSTNHINLNNITANIQLKALRADSLNINVRRLSMSDDSGLTLDNLRLHIEAGHGKATLTDFSLKSRHTELNIPHAQATYATKDGRPDLSTVKYGGEIGRSEITAADFQSILPALHNVTTPLTLTSTFSGTSTTANADINIVSADKSLALDVTTWVRKEERKTLWHANINRLKLTKNAISTIYDIVSGGKVSQPPNMISSLGDISLSGVAGATENNKLVASATLTTAVGTTDADITFTRSGRFNGTLATADTDLGALLGNGNLGHTAINVAFSGRVPKGEKPTATAKGTIESFEYNGYRYRDITLDAIYNKGMASATVGIGDTNANVDITASVNTSNKSDIAAKVTANVRRLAPLALGLTKKWRDAVFSANINADIHGSNIDNLRGYVNVAGFQMRTANNEEPYTISNVNIQSGYNDGRRVLTVGGDFGHVEMVGRFKPSTIANSLSNFAANELPTLPWLLAKKKTDNNFLLSATLYDTEWMDKILGVPLIIKQPLTINGRIDDDEQEIYLNATAPSFTVSGQRYTSSTFALTSPGSVLHCDAHTVKMLDNGDSLDIALTSQADDSKLSTRLSWSNAIGKRIAGTLNADAQLFNISGRKEVKVDIKPSKIDIDGTLWNVNPSSMVYTDKHLLVDNFSIRHGSQHILIDGTASQSRNDSLVADLNGVNLGYILNLVNFHAVEFDGLVSGKATLRAPFGDLSADGRLSIANFTFENGDMGTYDTDVAWNSKEGQIDIDGVSVASPDHKLYIKGFISPTRSWIDLDMIAENTKMDFMRSFMHSFSDDMDGVGTGRLRMEGPLSEINLTGTVVVDGSATIRPIGCKYFLKGDTVNFVHNDIRMNNAPIYDIYGHRGWVTGGIHHKHLTHMTYDLDVRADNLLVYDFKDFGNDTFYGTVYGTGHMDLHGRNGETVMNVNIRPQRNTIFVYNVADQNSVASQEFIHWNDLTPQDNLLSTANEPKAQHTFAERLSDSDLRLNFTLDVTPEATMKLLMDSKTNDYITVNGSGALQASYYDKGGFNMYGTYTVEHGTYSITMQDIIKKNFTFTPGGTMTFGGNPFDALLDLQAVYTVNGVSLSDLNIGSSFAQNTIRVNCLMNIGGQARKPEVSFDLDMPTVSTDEKQMVRSVLNGEDEMNQQVLYLLAIGRFMPQGTNNASEQSGRQQSQTSLAMQSFLSGTLSSQINTVLSSVIKSDNWNFGANIATGDDGWNNAEYEGLLSGRLLNNRLLINGQFGYRDNTATASSNFIGDFDIRYLLLPNGNLALKVYNQTNDRYFTKSSLNTQGLGLIMKKDFNGLRDLFGLKKKKNSGRGSK